MQVIIGRVSGSWYLGFRVQRVGSLRFRVSDRAVEISSQFAFSSAARAREGG